MTERGYEIGMVGLGVMGSNLVLNMSDHGHKVAGYNRSMDKIRSFQPQIEGRDIYATNDLAAMVGSLSVPRKVMMMIPAGPPVDSVIQELLSHLERGDLVIDGGNSHYVDTDRRLKYLEAKGILYIGVGISGGEHGARYGPSIMPGGHKEAYGHIQTIFEDIAAKADGDPCVRYLGAGSAGHYVKMVHNGIEYAIMQLIAETYDLMKRGRGLTDDEIQAVYSRWNESELSCYLLEITADIFEKADETTGKRLVDVILDEAKQKGTGKWTSQDAMELQVPTSVIHEAVAARDLSTYKDERETASKILGGQISEFKWDGDSFPESLQNALYAAMIIAYSQGFALLRKASDQYGYGINPEDVAAIWRGGCIIRAAVLKNIMTVLGAQPDLMISDLGKEVVKRQKDLREVIKAAAEIGVPTPAFMAALSYFDGYRSAWLPANLIQAQRDYFGAHTYERIDAKGTFHTEWEEAKEER